MHLKNSPGITLYGMGGWVWTKCYRGNTFQKKVNVPKSETRRFYCLPT